MGTKSVKRMNPKKRTNRKRTKRKRTKKNSKSNNDLKRFKTLQKSWKNFI